MQQIYVMRSDGSGVKRITFGKGIYGTPVWSPRGDLIAFTKMRKGRFYIGVMRIDGTGERLLTENYYQEAPSWSPNGRVLVFYKKLNQDQKERVFLQNYGPLTSLDIMKEGLKLKPMLQTHLGPLFYLNKVVFYAKYT